MVVGASPVPFGHPLRTRFACARPRSLREGDGGGPPLSFGHFPRERGKPDHSLDDFAGFV